jgi:catechol 2,3-dioxygenase-like lactoylglutathione lyase family enzyme
LSTTPTTVTRAPAGPLVHSAGLHHIAVETADLDNCVSWYTAFFGASTAWSLDTFSDLTHSRLPGITRLTEIHAVGLRFHIFSRDIDYRTPAPDILQFQHVCLAVESPEALNNWRERWQHLYTFGDFTFARDERATEIVIDQDQVSSFYAYDVNGLEFEFTHVGKEGR